MNLLLLGERERVAPDRALITDQRRIEHIRRVLKAGEGDCLSVGQLNGPMGRGTIVRVDDSGIELQTTLDQTPPPALPLTLILALPRPQQIKRILQTIASTGIKELHLIHTRRVEKSYWQSPSLSPGEVTRQLHLGLEQGCDTLEPNVHYHRRFRPFVEDVLASLIQERRALVAHPYEAAPCPAQVNQPTTLAVGPEGGFNEFEIEQFRTRGFEAVHLGERILKTETAIPFLLGRLF